jgi:hypothetical protein
MNLSIVSLYPIAPSLDQERTADGIS